jgi:hypothetical protein
MTTSSSSFGCCILAARLGLLLSALELPKVFLFCSSLGTFLCDGQEERLIVIGYMTACLNVQLIHCITLYIFDYTDDSILSIYCCDKVRLDHSIIKLIHQKTEKKLRNL